MNRPPGNNASGKNVCIASGVGTQPCDVLDTYIATSTTRGATWSSTKVSTVGHQPDYEMFGGRTDQFQGDYIWVDARGGSIFGAWTTTGTSCRARIRVRTRILLTVTASTSTSAGPQRALRTRARTPADSTRTFTALRRTLMPTREGRGRSPAPSPLKRRSGAVQTAGRPYDEKSAANGWSTRRRVSSRLRRTEQ